MTLSEWLNKPRLSDENWRKQMEFVGKAFAVLVGAIWLLAVGTNFIDKRGKALGKLGLANPDTTFSELPSVAASEINNGYCEIKGQYQIRNQGELTFEIDRVEVSLFQVTVRSPDAETGTYSFSTDTQIMREPSATELFRVNERLHPENELERSFGFGIQAPTVSSANEYGDYAYVVVARASGGLPPDESWLYAVSEFLGFENSELTRFKQNDLRVVSKKLAVCRPTDFRKAS